jgi:plastocyanin
MKLPFLLPLAVVVLTATVGPAPAGRVEEHIVEIRDFVFIPDKILARPGDKVTWINRDIVPHTATARDGDWDTGEIGPNGRKTVELSPRFSREYFCVYHPAMRGVL